MNSPTLPEALAALHAELVEALPEPAAEWLEATLRWAADADWESSFAVATRRVGRAALPRSGMPATDAARVLLLHAVDADLATVTRLYQQGDAAERRAVLQALPWLRLGPEAIGLVEDALRTNDTRLVVAAAGDYAAAHLDQHQWRHAVLKCVFTGVPLSAVSGLAARTDAELIRMLADYAAEREAAGRPVPDDVRNVLAQTPHPQES
ncbi:EboA domain-containing protein [Streptomyces triticirhizae]|uniref:Sugar phosphate isomerase n=1 Tax=Streptomyces triticirhizae TaxID=2483353 RepID=A0A3M2LG37_9ACTN|nr:EboA domain-containing protein [Streptomyces triticirhizae]RMI36442.1 sugar phosphate isomerase [Streptomyces triticirhizae]